MQDKARMAKEEHTKRHQLKKAELKMYKDEAIAVESWLMECRMEKIAKRYVCMYVCICVSDANAAF